MVGARNSPQNTRGPYEISLCVALRLRVNTGLPAIDRLVSGALRWKFRTGDVVHASPAIANGLVYVGSWDSNFYAIDAKSGRERWRFKTGEDHEIANQVGIQSSAVISDGLVYFGCRDSNLYALDAVTGAKKWAYSNKGSWVISTPIALDGTLYFATSDSGLLNAVDAKTGAQVFAELSSLADVFIAGDCGPRPLYWLPCWHVVGDRSRQARHRVDLQHRWRESQLCGTDEKRRRTHYAAVFADNFYDDMVIGVWKMLSIGAVLTSPVIERDMIYFGSADGNLYAIS